jgi:DGQHR domain-containing protein
MSSRVLDITVSATDMSTDEIKAYLCVLNADEIFSVAEVVHRKEDRQKGFQRNLSQRRVRQIVAYLSRPRHMLANNIIIAFNRELSFNSGNLVLPTDEDKRGWVVDGQHRLAGVQQAQWKHKLAVVILSALTIEEMAALFRTINSTQKGVPTSLLYDLLGMTKDGDFEEIRGHELAVKLSEEPESPLYNNIDMLGSGPSRITQSRIVKSLKPLITGIGLLGRYSIEEQFGILKNYFSAIITRVGEETFRSSEHIFLTALGFAALVDLLPTVFTDTLATCNDFKVDSICQTVKGIEEYDFSRGIHKGLGGDAGAAKVSKDIAQLLRTHQDDSDSPSIRL